MGSYVGSDENEILQALGINDADELYKHIPGEVRLNRDLNTPKGKTEMEVEKLLSGIAAKNTVYNAIYRGAGAYDHYIPAAVWSIASKEAFVTAYTPYQAEISQGVLQGIFEYQSMVCELTGMDASNASVYSGAVAAAEAVNMCRDKNRDTVIIPDNVNPQTIEVVKTYASGYGMTVKVVSSSDGLTDPQSIKDQITDGKKVACIILQQPNYYGLIEDAETITQIEGLVHNCGGKLIMSCNPTSLAVLKTPAAYSADIAVGDMQPFGMPLAFGGPYCGYMACKEKLTRSLPGRIVGETTFDDGRRAYVLTLQAREQHIRREKASTSICTNNALNALTASIYANLMGDDGLVNVAETCMDNARYAYERILNIKGFNKVYDAPFFHEFVTGYNGNAEALIKALEDQGILGGLVLEGNRIMWCFTERYTHDDIDRLVSILEANA